VIVCLSAAEPYNPRNPRKSQYYRCVEAKFEKLERVWDERYQNKYGYWRPHVIDVIYKYLDCGDLHQGFARVKCDDCNHEYLLPFSCKRRYFCPSCHQKRVVEFGEFLYEEVLCSVPHRQWVFSLPKRLRLFFLYDRSLLSKLSRCAWKVLSCYLTNSVSMSSSMPGAVISVQTFGDFLNFNPHLHIISTDGCFNNDGSFMTAVTPNANHLEPLFRLEVLNMLKREGKITDAVIENMSTWHHSGFHVYCGDVIRPDDEEGLEHLAHYVIRAPISQERMIYIAASETPGGIAKVIYTGKNSRVREQFTALDWLARLVTHIPNKGEQLIRYYGFYSNKVRGVRKKAEAVNTAAKNQEISSPVLSVIENKLSRKAFRRNWARLIQKVYHTDPLVCPKCNGNMKIIAFIEEEDTIRQILKHLGLWLPGNHDPPEQKTCPAGTRIFNMIEMDFDTSLQAIREEIIPQMPYEDDYSQITPYDDECIGL
jgi:ribosomal protein S27E